MDAAQRRELRKFVRRLRARLGDRADPETAFAQLLSHFQETRDPRVLGLAYQFWTGADKQRVLARLRTEPGAKVEGSDVIAVTSLATEPYMAGFLLRHGLEALWKRERTTRSLESITLLDPACGTGALLLPAFDWLYTQYAAARPEADPVAICSTIFANNLFGLDIDARAVAIAHVSLRMRALERAPDFVGEPTHVVALAHELGSLVRAPKEGDKVADHATRLLATQYDAVVTNPPYLGPKYMGERLKKHLAEHHPDAREDLLTAFLDRCFALARPGGVVAAVTTKSWLHQAAFRAFRRRVLGAYTLGTFADLGSRAFPADLGLHHGVNVILTCFWNEPPAPDHLVQGFRVTGGKGPAAKEAQLAAAQPIMVPQAQFLALADAPLCYDLPASLLRALETGPTLRGRVKQGLATTDNRRFLRYAWEVPDPDPARRWFPCAKGGTYRKWAGLDYVRVNWQAGGFAIKNIITRKYPYLSGAQWVAKNEGRYFQPGLTYSYMCYGSLSARLLRDAVFEVASIAVFPEPADAALVLATLNARTTSFVLRALSQKHMFQAGMAEKLPLPVLDAEARARVGELVDFCIQLKRHLLRFDPREPLFSLAAFTPHAACLKEHVRRAAAEYHAVAAWLHTAEGLLERIISDGYGLSAVELQTILQEMGTPAAWFPLPEAARTTPPLPSELPRPPHHLVDSLGDIYPTSELPPANPIPAETELEKLALAQRLHPFAAWRLLHDEPPLAEQYVADYLLVIVLELLRNSPDLAIPLTPGCGVPTLFERVTSRLAADFPGCPVEQTVQDLGEFLGVPLELWLQTHFFLVQTRRLERRPLAWQLQSRPAKRGRPPAFACLVYYHHLRQDTLGLIRERLVAPLFRDANLEARSELKQFQETLQTVEVSGFGTGAQEPLDRGYIPDLHDGVRVNLAPLQQGGILAAPVLPPHDVARAIADRAAWRADECQWCREGRLPRPGWWPDAPD